jgi:nitrite reductase/ring-hydroxylating ferredoxin subunit
VAGTSPRQGTQDGWVALSLDQPMGVEPAGHRVGDADLVLLERDGQLLAYRDACPGCGDSLVSGPVQGDVLCCPGCGRGYDVRLAGRAVDAGNAGLAPVPLLQQDGAVRIATGALR